MALTKYETNQAVKDQIEGIFSELLELCQMNRIPMFATVAIENNEENTEYDNTVYNAVSHGITLTDDRIRRHMLIAGGFDAVPPRESVTFDPFGVLEGK